MWVASFVFLRNVHCFKKFKNGKQETLSCYVATYPVRKITEQCKGTLVRVIIILYNRKRKGDEEI